MEPTPSRYFRLSGALPTHHPIAVNKMKVRQVELYHFSWLSILTKARLLSDDKTIDDPEQAFILRELIRYLSHEASGVCQMTRLGKDCTVEQLMADFLADLRRVRGES
ncbi:MAG: hypothetical protein WD078_14330 [Woeseia sp.]